VPLSAAEVAYAVDQWGGRLRYWLASRTTDVDDIVQETFCKLIEQNRMPDRPAAWLFQVAANLLYQEARRKRRRKTREQQAATQEGIQPAYDSELLQQDVQIHLAKLPQELRDIVLLKIWGEMTFAEIARQVNVSTATAQRKYVDALSQLQSICGYHEPENAQR
jgi:RNA polymerase sigma-70 factor (ECF subfamily)